MPSGWTLDSLIDIKMGPLLLQSKRPRHRLCESRMTEISVHYSGPIVTRDDAKVAGLKRFFIGDPCFRGHIHQRLVSTRGCVACTAFLQKKNGKHPSQKKWISENRAKINGYSAAWRERNPEKVKAGSLNRNKESQQEYDRKRWVEDREAQQARRRKYVNENREHINTLARKRRALNRGAPGSHTKHDIQEIGERQKWKCAACAKGIAHAYHVDHIMPLYLGGSNDKTNLQLLCKSCNSKKGKKHPLEFARQIGRLL